jgi:Ca2+-binding RTX toxin-like protein
MKRGSRTRAGLVATLAAAALSAALAAGAGAATITVSGSGDVTANDGTCTLREAVDAANGNAASGAMAGECAAGDPTPTRDVVLFSVGGAGSLQTIAPGTNLPPLTGPVEIDGRNGHASLPRIRIDASTFPMSTAGLIASTNSENSYLHHLAITGAPDDGVRLLVGNITLERLVIGLTLADAAAGNGGDGVSITGPGSTVRDSVISNSGANGIGVTSSASAANTTIAGNKIGTNLTGTSGFGNAFDGVSVPANSVTSPTNLVIGGSNDPTPGGACDGDCNVISGNGSDGIEITATTSSTAIAGPVIRGNFIGSDAAGTVDLGNTAAGMRINGNISGAVLRDNVVAGNGGDGITLSPGTVGGPSNSAITGNRIGVDRQGDDPLPNSGRGINMAATVTVNAGAMTGNVIGGTTDPTPGGACDGDCNVIGGNGIDGIDLVRGSGGVITGTQILGNHIGADAAGSAAAGNSQWGILLAGVTGTVVGSPAAPNVISGNGLSGLLIQANAGGGNVVQANRIGTSADGAGALGNQASGVDVFTGGSGVTVGGVGAGAGNTIANNVEAGVRVSGSGSPTASLPILGNSTYANGGLGIDLMPDGLTSGVTPNDGAGDADSGGNGLQNFPDLETVAVAGGSTFVLGSLDTSPSTRFRIEVFASQAPDSSGHGEGRQLVGAFEITTNAAGHANLFAELPGTVAAGQSTTATATELDGAGTPLRTSEFATNIPEGCDIAGGAGADTIAGSAKGEVICGLGGDDVIEGGGGDDVIVGGPGADAVSYASAGGAAVVDLPAGTGSAAGAGSDRLLEIENATGSAVDDQLTALAAGSALSGLAGNDILTGGAGPDVLDGGEGDDDASGGDGGDTVLGQSGDDALSGDGGDDTVQSHGGRDDIEGGTGSDTVKAGGGDRDEARGQGGDDTVKGGGGEKDDVRGGGGKDRLDGGGGKKDDCDGGGGKDHKPAPGCEKEKSIP